MPVRTILVPSWPGCDEPDRRLDAALAVARRVGAHIEVLFVRVDSALLAAALPGAGAVAEGLAERVERDNQWAARDARSRFEAWRERHRVPGELEDGMARSTFARWSERVGLPAQVVVHKGRLSDLVVLDFPEPLASGLDRVLDAALFETERPVLLVPPVQAADDDPLRSVTIAWNGSLEATRAGAALLRAARDQGASLLVMGAFTHGRTAGVVLGGVTGYVLRDPPSFPVLMAH